jgi:hypothetical protein
MDLKNAAAVCLIALCSATLVVLIARFLDNQAASRLEPQLANIVEELRAIRGQGGAISSTAAPKLDAVREGLVVYYFHNNMRCPTCRSIESQAHETVQNQFASQLRAGAVVWKIVNYDQEAAKPLATKFDIQMPVVVLARMKDGQVSDWKRLDQVWALVGDKPAFAKYMRGEIDAMLAGGKRTSPAKPQTSVPPLPASEPRRASAMEAPPIPLPGK